MTISNEAVEAAAKAIFDVRDDPYDMDEWEDIDSTEREPFECQARAALEAAAPIIRAEAWQEGYDAGTNLAAWAIGNRPDIERPDTDNPYRAAEMRQG